MNLNTQLLDIYGILPELLHQQLTGRAITTVKKSLPLVFAMNEKEGSFHGIRTPYFDSENRSDRTLVVLHGFSDSRYSFLSLSPQLRRHSRVVIPDLPAFGDSCMRADVKYDIPFYTKWLREFIVRKNLNNVVVAGNSLGGAIALQYALEYPDDTAGLILMNNAGVPGRRISGMYREIADGENLFLVEDKHDFEGFMNRIFHQAPPMPLPVWHKMYDDFQKNRGWYEKLMTDLFGDVVHTIQPEDFDVEMLPVPESKLRAIRHPVRILWGANDTLFPVEIADYLQEVIPGAGKIIFPGCGHVPHLEAPLEVGRAMADFTAGIPVMKPAMARAKQAS